jgi:UDP-glucose 4-epimerase
MRVVITGASGNVGTALTRRLLEAGEYDIVAMARRIPDYAAVDGAPVGFGDLSSRDCGFVLRRVIRGCGCASVGIPAVSPGALPRGSRGRRHSPRPRCDRLSGYRAVAYMSSVGAYAPKRDASPVHEQWPVEAVPSSSYGWHKVAAERDFSTPSRSLRTVRPSPGCGPESSVSTTAGSALLRYALPAFLPAKIIDVSASSSNRRCCDKSSNPRSTRDQFSAVPTGETHSRGFACRRSPERSHGAPGRIRTCDARFRKLKHSTYMRPSRRV